jgi:hypothetical protein
MNMAHLVNAKYAFMMIQSNDKSNKISILFKLSQSYFNSLIGDDDVTIHGQEMEWQPKHERNDDTAQQDHWL